MFAADSRVLAKLAPMLRRVLIVDPNPHSARMLNEIIKGFGAAQIVIEPNTDRALRTADHLEPGVIFTERTGDKLDGEALARNVRRSHMACRRVPIIMVTAEATASTI